jgi:hypothetical protein
MQNEPHAVSMPNPETVHASSQAVCFGHELAVRKVDERILISISMRMTLRAGELLQKL